MVAPRTVEARFTGGNTRRCNAQRLFLNFWTRAAMPSIPGLVEAAPLTHVQALELGRVPPHSIVRGGGYVESSSHKPFGSEVILARMLRIAFERDVFRVHFADRAADMSNVGIPGHVVVDFEYVRHDRLP